MMEPWQEFEQNVARLFRLKGFVPVADTTFAGRQHDLVLASTDEAYQPILVECKYHDPAMGTKVGVKELEDFAGRVLRLRSSGDISSGYLVTNTGFTSSARGAYHQRPEAKFVLLRTVDEIRRGLVNFDRYIHHTCDEAALLRLEEMYEPLSVSSAREKKNRQVSVNVVDELLAFVNNSDQSLFVLTGDYGTGKTTILRQLTLVLARDYLAESTSRIPIFVPLKWYNQAGGAIALLRRFLDEHSFQATTVDALLAMHGAGQLVLLLDGFDEMLRRSTNQTRRESLQDLVELCTSNSKVILSGRPGYFVDDLEFRAPFRRVGITGVRDRITRVSEKSVDPVEGWSWFDVESLQPEQIRSFLIRRSDAKSIEQREQRVDRMIARMNSTYNLRDLATRPILLEMMELTLGGPEISEAVNPAELYRQYVDVWLQVDADKGAFRGLITPEDRLSFSIMLAWLLHDREEDEIHWSELQDIVGDYFQIAESDDIDHFSSDVRTCTFLSRNDDGFLGFSHTSFQEYFCARFLVEEHAKIRHLVRTTLEYPDITLLELADSSSAILDFVGDMLSCPVNPYFWEEVRDFLLEKPDRLLASQINQNSLDRVLTMAEGNEESLNLLDIASSYRAVYKQLIANLRDENSRNPDDEWVRRILRLLERGRPSG